MGWASDDWGTKRLVDPVQHQKIQIGQTGGHEELGKTGGPLVLQGQGDIIICN